MPPAFSPAAQQQLRAIIQNAQGAFPNAGLAIAQVLAALQAGTGNRGNGWARSWFQREFGSDSLVDVWEQLDDYTRLELLRELQSVEVPIDAFYKQMAQAQQEAEAALNRDPYLSVIPQGLAAIIALAVAAAVADALILAAFAVTYVLANRGVSEAVDVEVPILDPIARVRFQ